jgi:hypothetical protein
VPFLGDGDIEVALLCELDGTVEFAFANETERTDVVLDSNGQ